VGHFLRPVQFELAVRQDFLDQEASAECFRAQPLFRMPMSPVLEKLLVLQDRDAKRLGFDAQLKAIPRDITSTEQKISRESEIETARAEAKALE